MCSTTASEPLWEHSEWNALRSRIRQNEIEEFSWFNREAKAKKHRTRLQFAEQELVLPDGPYAGRRFRAHHQPYTAVFLDAIEHGWEKVYVIGPSQAGKTMLAFVLQILFHLFELKETVGIGVPSIQIARDKWRSDILPAIRASRFAVYLPSRGAGSSDGDSLRYDFTNGVTLRFFTAGGHEKSRAGFTCRTVAITEADGFRETSGDEGKKFDQVLARTNAFGRRRQIYAESTVSNETGIIWTGHQQGTCSELFCRCPHCGGYVRFEREQLVGWQNARTESEAGEESRFICSLCSALLNEQDRLEANGKMVLVAKGQAIDRDGIVTGEPPKTRQLGLRFSAFHNLFATISDLGISEWRAANDPDQESADRVQSQFVWAIPPKAKLIDVVPLSIDGLVTRQGTTRKGVVPIWAERLTIGVDVRSVELHWVVSAWSLSARGRVVDYGTASVYSDRMPEALAIPLALREFLTGFVAGGWIDESGKQRSIDFGLVDANYMTDAVFQALNEVERLRPADQVANNKGRILPFFGRGHGQLNPQPYYEPKSTGNTIKSIGLRQHISWDQKRTSYYVEGDVDYWKTSLHKSLLLGSSVSEVPSGLPLIDGLPVGSVDFPKVSTLKEHATYCRHLLAEVLREEYVEGKGWRSWWETKSRANHWLDATVHTLIGASIAGVQFLPMAERNENRSTSLNQEMTKFETPDGREFLVTERED